MSEIFWENLEPFYEKFKGLLELRGELLKERSQICADAIRDAGAPLHDYVGFIDCNKIRTSRPSKCDLSQRAYNSGHKRIHYLIYQIFTTPDGLIFGCMDRSKAVGTT